MAKSRETISTEELMMDLQKKIYNPVYFLSGDEPYYVDKITEYFMQNVLTEAEKAFNLTVIYGKDSDGPSVINHAKRFPMMANYHLVIVKEAQELKDFDKLIHYIEKPLKSTILVINYKYKDPDKRKKIFKSLQENAVYYVSKKLYDNKIPDWIVKTLGRKKYKIEPKAAALLSEFVGNDLSKISNEIEKLLIVLPDPSHTINASDIEKNIGISKEYNIFELNNALSIKDVVKANRIINYFADNQKNNNIVPTIGSLFGFFNKVLVYHSLQDKSQNNIAANLKINPYFVKEYEVAARNYSASKVISIISLLREYDAKSKGFGNVSADAGALLKELIFKILH